jgi:hypothetical protein
MSKGAQFGGFRGSRVRGVLGGIYSIPLDLASFGGPNPWSDSGDRELDLGELTRGCCSSPSGPA